MDETVNNFMMTIIYALISIVFISIITYFIDNQHLSSVFITENYDAGNHFELRQNDLPCINVLKDKLALYSDEDVLDCIDVYYQNRISPELKKEVIVYGAVNKNVAGIYPVTFVIEYQGMISRKEVNIQVL